MLSVSSVLERNEDEPQWRHHTLIRTVRTLRMMWDKLHPSYTAVGPHNYSRKLFWQLRQEIHMPHDPVIHSWIYIPQKDIHRDIHSSTVCSSPRPKQVKCSPNGRRRKSTEIQSYRPTDWWRRETTQKTTATQATEESQKREWVAKKAEHTRILLDSIYAVFRTGKASYGIKNWGSIFLKGCKW